VAETLSRLHREQDYMRCRRRPPARTPPPLTTSGRERAVSDLVACLSFETHITCGSGARPGAGLGESISFRRER